MIVDEDVASPLPDRLKGSGKKSRVYTQEEMDAYDTLLLHLKSEALTIQFGLETAGLTQYRNTHVPGLRGAPNTDDHSAYMAEVRKESWSYPAKGNLLTARQFFNKLQECGDPEKMSQGKKVLQDKGMPGVPQDYSPKGGKQEMIKAHYVMKVLWSIKGEEIDVRHPDYSRYQNIGLHDIMNPVSMRKVEKNGQVTVRGKSISASATYGYCLLCPYAS